VLEALLFGVVASSALVIGGLIGAYWDAPQRVSGVLLAFASGALIGALAFELFPEAAHLGGVTLAGLGLLAGGAVFVGVNHLLDRKVEGNQAEQSDKKQIGATGNAVGFALLAAVTLDGVPENLALGVSLAGGAGSFTLLVAIFASNLPESLVGAIGMRQAGQSRKFAIGIWTACGVILAIAVVLGQAALSGAPDEPLAFCLAFAGGAVLASLADTLMPEAFEHGRPWNSLATGVGFFVSFILG
jgi:zinc transporter, ZIP family